MGSFLSEYTNWTKQQVALNPKYFFLSVVLLWVSLTNLSLWWQFLCHALVLGCLTDGLLVSCVLLGNWSICSGFPLLVLECMCWEAEPVPEKGSNNLSCCGGALSLCVGRRGGLWGGQQCEAGPHNYHKNGFQCAQLLGSTRRWCWRLCFPSGW